jgi:hypothetical protein
MESALAPGPRNDPFDHHRRVADKDESLLRLETATGVGGIDGREVATAVAP